MRRFPLIPAAALLFGGTFLGCAPEDTGPNPDLAALEAEANVHPTEGPHHGSLIELGDEEYHAELIHDADAGTVTIYLLDDLAEESAYTDAKEVTITLSHEGEEKTFVLPAAPADDDDEGMTSQFVSTEAALGEELDHDHDDVKLMIDVDGRSFTGDVAHSVEDHDHDH